MNFAVIEQKRLEKNLTVTAFCKLAGIDRGTYYKIKANPDSLKFSTATKIVRALKLNAAEKSQVLS